MKYSEIVYRRRCGLCNAPPGMVSAALAGPESAPPTHDAQSIHLPLSDFFSKLMKDPSARSFLVSVAILTTTLRQLRVNLLGSNYLTDTNCMHSIS